jgi:hypothetical protein
MEMNNGDLVNMAQLVLFCGMLGMIALAAIVGMRAMVRA